MVNSQRTGCRVITLMIEPVNRPCCWAVHPPHFPLPVPGMEYPLASTGMNLIPLSGESDAPLALERDPLEKVTKNSEICWEGADPDMAMKVLSLGAVPARSRVSPLLLMDTESPPTGLKEEPACMVKAYFRSLSFSIFPIGRS